MVEQNQSDQPKFTPAPPNPSETPLYENEERRGMPTKVESPMKSYVISAVIAFVIIFIYTTFITPVVNKKEYAAVVTRLENDLVIARDVEKKQGDRIAVLETSSGALANSISKQLADVTNNVNSKTSDLASKISGLAIASDVNSKIASLQTTIASDKSESNKKLDAQTASIKALEDRIKNLGQSQTSTTSGGSWGGTTVSGVTLTPGQVTVAVLGNSFTGSQMLAFPSIAANTTASQSFVFQLANGLDHQINGIQLAIGLQIMDANGNPYSALPSTTFSLTSPGMTTMWTEQGTGVAYFRGFVNSSASLFQGMGNMLSLGMGTASYTITITASNSSGASVGPFNIVPLVRVISWL